MAETDSAQEKTEQPTAKRLADARRKGQIPRSRDLTTMLMMMGAALTFSATGSWTGKRLLTLMQEVFSPQREALFQPEIAVDTFYQAIFDGLYALAPFLAAMTVIALASPLALGGWAMSAEAIKFDASRLDPIKGMGRVFGVRGLTEMLKALAKFLVVGLVAALMLWNQLDHLVALAQHEVLPGVRETFSMVLLSFFVISAGTIAIALVDVPLQLWQHTKQLKMSRQEVKEEFKDTDGRPEVKGRIRQLQQEMAQRRMMEEVPKADVVITNPTHFSVAIRYDGETMGAPRVVASGADEIAFSIRKVAQEHAVPLLEAPMLARALFHTTKVGDEVPRELYLATAQILAYVFQIKEGVTEISVPNPEVPPGFEY